MSFVSFACVLCICMGSFVFPFDFLSLMFSFISAVGFALIWVLFVETGLFLVGLKYDVMSDFVSVFDFIIAVNGLLLVGLRYDVISVFVFVDVLSVPWTLWHLGVEDLLCWVSGSSVLLPCCLTAVGLLEFSVINPLSLLVVSVFFLFVLNLLFVSLGRFLFVVL